MIGKIILGIIATFIVVTLIRAIFFKPKLSELKAEPWEKEKVDVMRAARHLSEAITYKTIATTNPEDTDFNEFDKFHDFLEREYPLIHQNMSREIVSRASLIYHWKGKNPALKPIAMLSHQDVVPVTPGTENDWEHPAFEGHNDGKIIWGRGALDMKNHLIAVMEAVETLMQEGYEPERDVYLCFGHDEEVNDNDLAGAIDIKNVLKERGVRLESVLDEGGAFLPINFKGFIKNQHLAAVGMAEKGYSDYRITIHAKGGHSSQPPKHTGIGKMANVIKDLENNQFKAKMLPFINDMFINLTKRGSYIVRVIGCNYPLLKPLLKIGLKQIPPAASLIRTTTAVTMATGSPASNVLPQKASIVVNFRQFPGTSVADVEKHIRKVVRYKDIDVELLGSKEVSNFASEQSTAYQSIKNLCLSIDPKNTIMVPFLVMGSTDAYYYEEICDNVLRFSPFRVSAELLMRTHATNECCPVDTLEEATAFFKKYIRINSSNY